MSFGHRLIAPFEPWHAKYHPAVENESEYLSQLLYPLVGGYNLLDPCRAMLHTHIGRKAHGTSIYP